MQHLTPMMRQNFLEYASYVIVDRAIPDARDGLKPVQRRILATLFGAEDGKFHKVANIIGETMKLHPHGDASIGEALVVLANKDYFLEKQGNFGSVITGHSAAAPRYIECRLTELAKRTLFFPALTAQQPSYDGRRQEPVFLPAKLPVALLLGTEGIAVGMATKILPHNFQELLGAQIAQLRGDRAQVLPDFPHGGLMDASEYQDGRGRVRVRADLRAVGDKKVVIRQIPFTTTCESLIASIEAAIGRGRVKASSINDFTTDQVEIEVRPARGTAAQEIVQQLYAYTDCEVSISSNIVVIDGHHPRQMGVAELLALSTERLTRQIEAELEHELGQLRERHDYLLLERMFVEHRVYKRLESARSPAELDDGVRRGLAPYLAEHKLELGEREVERLLSLPVRRISQYDLGKHQEQLTRVAARIREARGKLRRLTDTTIGYLEGLLAQFGSAYPRRTQVKQFQAVDRRAIAQADLRILYDSASGFLGTDVKHGELKLTVSEFDLMLAIGVDGSWRVEGARGKVLVGELAHLAAFDPELGQRLVVVYRDGKRQVWAKRVHLKRFVRGRAYQLLPAKGDGRIDLVLADRRGLAVRLARAQGRGSSKSGTVHALDDVPEVGVTTRGVKLASAPTAQVTEVSKP